MNEEKNKLFTKILIIGTIVIVVGALLYAGIKRVLFIGMYELSNCATILRNSCGNWEQIQM